MIDGNYYIDKSYLIEVIKDTNVSQLIKGLQEGNEEQVEIILNDILSKSISYYDNYETFYHGFLVGLFQENKVKSNKESADGRFDVVIYRQTRFKSTILIECKYSKGYETMKKDSEEVIQQMKIKNYQAELVEQGINKIQMYGIKRIKELVENTSSFIYVKQK